MTSVIYRSLNDLKWMYRRSDTEIRNAFHEAGHALVALGFGVEMSHVTIVPDTHRGGHVQMLADSRGWGSDEQQVTIYAAGRAGEEIGPSRLDDAWIKDVRYRGDLTMIEDLLPDYSAQDVRRAVDTAKRCIRAWPYTFDNIVEALLRSGSLDWAGVLKCVAGHEDALANYWKRFAVVNAPAPVVRTITEPVVKPSPQPASRPTPTRAEMIQVLEQIHDDMRNDRFIPAHIRRLVAQAEDLTPSSGRYRNMGVDRGGAPVWMETR